MNKITIIGAGNVGSTIAYTLAIAGVGHEIVMIDINAEKAKGEAMDIRQALPFYNSCEVYAGDYSDAKDSNIVILTSGVARKPGQTRLDLAQTNVNITKMIIPQIVKYAPDAFYIIVSNPVDILTYTFCKLSGVPESRIIGSGTLLDTARARAKISEIFNISQQNVHCYVFGEHGDSSFIPWSAATITSISADEYGKASNSKEILKYDEIEHYVRKSGGSIIERKGATFYGVAASVVHICKCILSGFDTAVTVSTMMNGEYGISDVCLSVLTVVGEDGAHTKINMPLTEKETQLLTNSANVLKDIIKCIEI